jgi:hypothetical protein
MISIVIPTLWRVDFKDQFELFHDNNVVNEVILINNDTTKTPDWVNSRKYKKLIEIKPHSNIFVNPAWNIGVKLASSNNIMLQNDDVICENYNFLNQIDMYLDNENCLIGVAKECYTNQNNSDMFLENISNKNRDWGFGCMMFFRKAMYRDIPKEYRLWKGDDFLIDLYKHKKLNTYTINGLNMHGTKVSATIDDSEFNWKWNEADNLDYNSFLEKYLET